MTEKHANNFIVICKWTNNMQPIMVGEKENAKWLLLIG